MEDRASSAIRVCLFVLLTSVKLSEPSDVKITALPHGLLERTEVVQTSNAVYQLIVVYGSDPLLQSNNVSGLLDDLSNEIKSEQLPGMSFASALLNQLAIRYDKLTQQNRDPTGAVAPKSGQEQLSGNGQEQLFGNEDERDKMTNGLWLDKTRNKRGLFDFVGRVGKELFGVATDDDIKKIEQVVLENRKVMSIISHKSEEMISIVNVSRIQMIENRNTVNKLIQSVTDLKEWVSKVNLRHIFYQVFIMKVQLLETMIRDLERINDKMLRVRKDLENGVLSEDLLPIEELRRLITSAIIPMGSKFVSPAYWYYSKMNIRVLKIGLEIVYSVDLPLVSEKKSVAKEFKSFPAPNRRNNVTLQISLSTGNRGLYKSHSGQVIELPNDCIGDQPLVCPPMAVKRDNFDDFSCAASLFNENNENKGQNCKIKISNDMSEKVFYHGVNVFILVTWGTEVTEGCLHNKVLSVNAGTYLIEWSGKCSLCTRYHCIPGVIQTGSRLRIENTWQAITIPKINNFSDFDFSIDLPLEMATPQEMTLKDLVLWESPDIPGIVWSNDETSVLVDIIIVIIIMSVCIIVCMKYFKICHYAVGKNKEEPITDLEVAIPLSMLNKPSGNEQEATKPLTVDQAADILVTNYNRT